MMKTDRTNFLRDTFRALLFGSLTLLWVACSNGEGVDQAGESLAGDDSHDEHENESVELTPAQVKAAAIHVQSAEPGEIARSLTLPAVVAANADTITHFNPKVPGLVHSIEAHLGQKVEEGQLMCIIDSVEFGNAVAELIRARALVSAAETTLELESALFEKRLETLEQALDGVIGVNRKIYEREQELQEKAVSTIRPLLEAEKALETSKLQKDIELANLRAERDARLLTLEVDLTQERILLNRARNAMHALGVEPKQLEELEPDSPLLAGRYEIRASRKGIVTERHITSGEFVDSQTKLFKVVDLSRVWVLASAFEEQVESVRVGQRAFVHLDAFPESKLEGVVDLIGYEVAPESRALRVRLELENPDLPTWGEEYPLRPGMYGRVELVVERVQARVVLPEAALVHEDEGDFVFLRTAPGLFERRHVELGASSGERVEIREGVEPGDEVAVTGTFFLKSALRKGELGGGHSH